MYYGSYYMMTSGGFLCILGKLICIVGILHCSSRMSFLSFICIRLSGICELHKTHLGLWPLMLLYRMCSCFFSCHQVEYYASILTSMAAVCVIYISLKLSSLLPAGTCKIKLPFYMYLFVLRVEKLYTWLTCMHKT